MQRLVNAVQRYAWGSTTAIQDFLGEAVDGEPAAELWMGTHPSAPSRVEHEDGTQVPLSELIGGDLPYLLKVLAAASPLSLQVHPTAKTAALGFATEQNAGLALDSPRRNFRDPHPKPEMAYALTRLESLVGFRPTANLLDVLRQVNAPLTDRMFATLESRPGYPGIVALLAELLDPGPSVAEVSAVTDACARLVAAGVDVDRAYSTVVEVAAFFPGDVGVVASLLLNRITLEPGEAAYLAPGIVHAHLSGMCLEVMSASDNVLRAGLTPKHRDPQTLLQCLEEGMSDAAYVDPIAVDGSSQVFAPPVTNFMLSITRADVDGAQLPASGRRIVICIEDKVEITARDLTMTLARGEAVFADQSDGPLTVTGTGVVAQAYEPA